MLLSGAFAQVRVWAEDRGFWHDELYVAVNLQKAGYRGLAGGLYWNQTAPPGWLMGEKAVLQFLGPDERLLRFPQLLAAVLALVLTAVVAGRIVGRWAAVVATALVAASPMMLYYAGEMKQYAVEAAAALAVILATHVLGGRLVAGTARVRDYLIFSGVAVLSMVGSYTALLAIAGALSGLFLVLLAERRWRPAIAALGAAAPGVLLGSGQVLLRKQYGFLANQDSYFTAGFPPPGAGPVEVVGWLPSLWSAFVDTPMSWRYPAAILAVAVIGLVSLVWRDRALAAAILLGVFVAASGAAAVHGFPMVERVALYLIAPLAIIVAAGADGTARLVRSVWAVGARSRGRVVLAAGLCAVVGWAALGVWPAVEGSVRQLRDPLTVAPYQVTAPDPALDNGRALVREVARQLRPGDAVLGYSYAKPLVSWYGPQYRLPVVGYVNARPAGQCPPPHLEQLLGAARRVWYVHLELLSYHPPDLHARVLAELARHGRVTSFRVYGPGDILGPSPAWVLVDLTQKADPAPPRFTPVPTGYPCLVAERP